MTEDHGAASGKCSICIYEEYKYIRNMFILQRTETSMPTSLLLTFCTCLLLTSFPCWVSQRTVTAHLRP